MPIGFLKNMLSKGNSELKKIENKALEDPAIKETLDKLTGLVRKQ